jgi:hypothetical protein
MALVEVGAYTLVEVAMEAYRTAEGTSTLVEVAMEACRTAEGTSTLAAQVLAVILRLR